MTLTTRRRIIGVAFASPWIIGFAVFLAYPIIRAAMYSFMDYSVLAPPRFIGLENYRNLLGDELFWISLWNTFYLFIIGIPMQLGGALVIAMLLNVRFKGRAFYRTVFFVPLIVPSVINALVWQWIFNPDVGMLNSILDWFNLPGVPWLVDSRIAKLSLILITVWTSGGYIIIFLAALQDVPQAMLEAAEIDGASAWKKTLYITLPLISPVILFNLIIGTIGTFQFFSEPYIMTGGGPMNSTEFYALYLFQNAFRYFRMGYASAQAEILFLIVIVISLTILRSSRKWVYYTK